MKKKLVLLLCLIACLFTITACSSKKEAASFDYDEATVTDTANQLLTTWNQINFADYTDEILASYVSAGQMDEATSTAYANWRQAQSDYGTFVEIVSTEIEEDGDVVNVIFTTKYEGTKNKVLFKVPFISAEEPDVTGITVEEHQTLSSKMESALLNTVLGMGTVFVVLIFISLLIGAFKIIPMIQAKMAKKQEAEMDVVEAIDNTVSQIVEQEEEELVDDSELVAVITAAIMASMGEETPADGLVVRSIKRAKTNKWQRA